MKKILKPIFAIALMALASCGGMSEEEKDKKITEAAEMRAKQVCESGDYEQKLNYLTEQLTEEGITEPKDMDKAIALFDTRVKQDCAGNHPDTPIDIPAPNNEPVDSVAIDTSIAKK